MIYELLSDEEMKALPRKVGRMKYEQVYTLMQEMDRLQKEHKAAIILPTPRQGYHRYEPAPPSTFRGCPNCRETQPWVEVDIGCPEYLRLQARVDAWARQKEHKLNNYAAIQERNEHRKVCQECTYKDAYYDGDYSCS